MQLEWYGQSAFRLTDGGTTVFIDPFDDLSVVRGRGLRWDYPAIEGVSADLLLVTHEHADHNGVGAIGSDAQIAALGAIDLLLTPIGAGPTIGAEQAMEIVRQVQAKVVVPAHYRTERIDFLEPVDAFAERFSRVHRADAPAVDLDALPNGDGPLLVLPAVP